MSEVCKVLYINEVDENRQKIDEEKFKVFYGDLSEADCIILLGSGRSVSVLKISMGGLDFQRFELKTIHDVGFPGKMFEAAPLLEKKFKKIVLLVNSGRGETSTPKQAVKELVRYIEKTGSKKFTIDATSSNPESTIGKAAIKYGNFLEVKGREIEPQSTEDFEKRGIMGDLYELLTLLIYQKNKEGLNQKRDAQWVMREMEREMVTIGKMIDEYIDFDWYMDLIKKMEKRSNVITDGLGISRIAVEMFGIRLQHVKRAIGDEVYLPNSSPPVPRAGDIIFFISRSGETAELLEGVEKYEAIGAEIYSVVRNESPLSRETKSLIIEVPAIQFHERATFILSPFPIKLAKVLKSHGREIPEYIMRAEHPLME